MIAVEFRGVTKVYHRQPVLKDVNFTIKFGTFAVIFGPPGCGKSVLVRLLTGLEKPSAGKIFVRGVDVTNVSPGERNIGYIPQMFALYPHYRVYDNIAYSLNLMGVPHSESDPLVREAAKVLGIDHLLGKRPDQLSGGEKQRVAIARGIVKKTDLYVLDDPLSGLDFKLREQLFDELKQMQELLHGTFVYTTSDPLETLMLAEHVEVVEGGRVVESGPLEQVYAQPNHIRTMELLDFPQANLFAGSVYTRANQPWCQTNLFEFPVQMIQPGSVPLEPRKVTVAVRAQDLKLDKGKMESSLTCRAQVVLKEDLGGELVVHLDAGGTPLVAVVCHHDVSVLADDVVTIGVRPSAMVLFAPDEGQRIGQGTEVSHV